MKRKHWTLIVPGAVLMCTSPAFAVDLREPVQAALNTNPEIRQAVHNKLATKEERKQAEGLWYGMRAWIEHGYKRLKSAGRVDLGHGVRYLNSPRHALEVEYYSYRQRLLKLLRRFGDRI